MSGLYGNKFLQESALNKITMGFKIKPHHSKGLNFDITNFM